MSLADPAPDLVPFVTDYLPGTVGHVVVAADRARSGLAIAVWLVSPTGQPTGPG